MCQVILLVGRPKEFRQDVCARIMELISGARLVNLAEWCNSLPPSVAELLAMQHSLEAAKKGRTTLIIQSDDMSKYVRSFLSPDIILYFDEPPCPLSESIDTDEQFKASCVRMTTKSDPTDIAYRVAAWLHLHRFFKAINSETELQGL